MVARRTIHIAPLLDLLFLSSCSAVSGEVVMKLQMAEVSRIGEVFPGSGNAGLSQTSATPWMMSLPGGGLQSQSFFSLHFFHFLSYNEGKSVTRCT